MFPGGGGGGGLGEPRGRHSLHTPRPVGVPSAFNFSPTRHCCGEHPIPRKRPQEEQSTRREGLWRKHTSQRAQRGMVLLFLLSPCRYTGKSGWFIVQQYKKGFPQKPRPAEATPQRFQRNLLIIHINTCSCEYVYIYTQRPPFHIPA